MAKCKSCSGPLTPNKKTCGYCGTINDIDLKGLHHYTLNKPTTDRICPCCKIPMQTLDLGIEGVFYIERCEQCLGIFFDSGELEAVLDKSVSKVFHVNIEKIQSLYDALEPANFKATYRNCPVCGELMHRTNYGKSSGIIIDSCRDHGLWLDGGELKQILEWKKAGGQEHAKKKARMFAAEKQRAEEVRAELKEEAARESTAGAFYMPAKSETSLFVSIIRFLVQDY